MRNGSTHFDNPFLPPQSSPYFTRPQNHSFTLPTLLLHPSSNHPPRARDCLSHHFVRQAQCGENVKMMWQAGIVFQPCTDTKIAKAFLQDDAVVAHRVFLCDGDVGGGKMGQNAVRCKEWEVRGRGAGCVDIF